MTWHAGIKSVTYILGGLIFLSILLQCDSAILTEPDLDGQNLSLDFPSFITPVNEYFELSISGNHSIDGKIYHLKITGTPDGPTYFSLDDLRKMNMEERTLTVECIGNPANGNLLGTITWKGFNMYKLLDSLGINDEVKFVKYLCSDGYFTYNTIEELQENAVLGALYMNDDTIPSRYGYPLRIIHPGYYGVRQPGWVVEIELLESGIMDYWGESQPDKWNTDSAMAIDSRIFFPGNKSTMTLGDSLKIGGAAFGSKRISSVELTIDNGETWIPARITRNTDQDYVWVFWEAVILPRSKGPLSIRSRATGSDGQVQPRDDRTYLDGTNSWPTVNVFVEEDK